MKKNNPKTVLFLLSAMSFLTSGDIYSSAPLLVSISNDLNISISSAALSVTAYLGAFALFNLFFGPFGDRFGRTRIVILCSFGTSMFSCLCFFADSLYPLLIYRAFNGVFAAGIMPVSVAIIGEVFEPDRRQKAIASMIGVMILGGASAALIGGGLSFFFSWKSVYLIYGLAELVVSFMLLFRLESGPVPQQKQGVFKMYRAVLKNRPALCCFCLVGMAGMIVAGAFSFTGELMRGATGLNLLGIGAVLSLFGTGGIVSSGIATHAHRFSVTALCITAGVLGGVSIYSLSVTTAVWGFAGALFVWGIAFVTIHSRYVAAAQNLIPELRGTVMALMSFCWLSGGTAGTLINTRVIEQFHINAIYVYTAVLFGLFSVSAAGVLHIISHSAPSPEAGADKRLACEPAS